MDDFGTGYSSLSYLRSFPFDKIKIDRSFVRDVDANRDAQAIFRSIVSLGKGLGVTITAEGVETEAELSCLRAEGCHEGQGFLFSRARPNAPADGGASGFIARVNQRLIHNAGLRRGVKRITLSFMR
jgi:EAL domain-containing protein (putative c-di-GMP-specific phosphodiesterase class I)